MARIALFTLLLIWGLCSVYAGWSNNTYPNNHGIHNSYPKNNGSYNSYPNNNGSHNLIIGRRGYNDVILFQKTVSKSNWKPWGKVSEDVTFPVKYNPYLQYISEIDIIDAIGKDQGGYAYIKNGNIGGRNVTIHFKSQAGKGYKFYLTIYGR